MRNRHQGAAAATENVNQAIRAYSYLRFSTPDQQAGDSFRRQTAAAEV